VSEKRKLKKVVISEEDHWKYIEACEKSEALKDMLRDLSSMYHKARLEIVKVNDKLVRKYFPDEDLSALKTTGYNRVNRELTLHFE